MAEIRQELGIDVSQAIQALNNLDRRLTQFGGALDRVAGQLRNFNTAAKRAFSLGNVTGDLDRAAASTSKVVQGFAGFAREADAVGQASNSAARGLNSVAAASQSASSAAATLGANTASGTGRAATAFQRMGATVSSVTTRVRGALGTLAANIRAFGAQSQQAIGGFTIGFQTLARIVSAQIAIRGINALSRAFTDSVSSAIEFQRQIAQIQTISIGSAFRDFDTAANQVRNLSDAFNVSLGDVGAGLYETISQQIRGTANQVEVLTQALTLSKVGVATTADSVALLTGTLNSFELGSTEAERVAAVLFRTVDLGNTTVSELANSFGTVATLAFEAGASFEELAAAFAVVTINGIDTAKAATQIRGVLNALIKPTEELQKVLEEAGFATGESAVQTLGLGGALNLIADAADGSQTELAKLIPRLRGITAQLILSRNSGEEFQTQLERIQQAAAQGIQEEFELRINTDAESVTRRINQLSNALTVDLGQAILGVLGFFARFETLINGTIRVVQFLGPTLVLAGVAFGTYAAAAGVAALANSAFTTSIVTAIGALTGFRAVLLATGATLVLAAGLGIGTFIATQAASKRAADAIAADTRRANAERIRDTRSTRQALLQEEIQGISERVGAVTGFVTKVRVALNNELKAWQENNKKIQANTEQVYGDILDANKKFVERLKRNAEDAAQAQIDSQNRVRDLRQSLEDTSFKQSLQGRDPISQSFLQQQRAAQLATEAVERLSSAVRSEDIDLATSASERALAAAEEAVQTAQTSGNRAAVTRALANQRQIVNDIIAAEQKQQALQKQRETDSKAAAAQEEARVRNLEAEINKVIELQKQFDPAASPIKRDAIIKEVEAAFANINKLAVPQGSKLTADQLIDLAKFQTDIQSAFQVAEAQGIDLNATLSGESLQKLNNDITEVASKAFEAGIRRAISAGLSADAIGQFQQLQQAEGPVAALDKLVNALNAERDRLIQIERNEENIVRASENLREAGEIVAKQLDRSNSALENTAQTLLTLPAALARGGEVLLGGGDRLGRADATSQLGALEQQLRSLPERSQFLSTEQLQQELQNFNQTFKGIVDNLGVDSLLTLGPQIRRLNEAIQTADQAIQTSVQQGTSLQENLNQALQGVRDTGKAAAEATGEAATSSTTLNQQLGAAVGPINQIQSASANIAANLAAAAQSSSQIGSTAPAQTAAFGGMIRYFNRGGFAPKGTDTVPAMLSPGEFVVNAKSTRKFFSQLQAINAGVSPRYFAEGGSVTNISIGDVNVTGSDSKSGDITGRQIARSLQRELRRKTSSLRR